MGVATGLIVGGSLLAGNLLTSRAQKKAADRQAEGIERASDISEAKYRDAVGSALELFDPAFKDISTSINNARGELLSGRASSQDILNQAFANSAQTLQTSSQQAMNAILGRSPAAPSSQLRVGDTPQKGRYGLPRQPRMGVTGGPSQSRMAVQGGQNGMGVQGGPSEQLGMPDATGGTPIPFRTDSLLRTADSPMRRPVTRAYGAELSDSFFSGVPAAFLRQQAQNQALPDRLGDVTAPMEGMEGEFIPAEIAGADFDLQAPAGDYGLAGAEQAARESLMAQRGALRGGAVGAIRDITQGFDQGRTDITGAADAARGDITEGMETARGDIESALRGSVGDIERARDISRGDIQRARDLGIGYMDPYSAAGQSARH